MAGGGAVPASAAKRESNCDNRRNQITVARNKPILFYVDVAKRRLKHNDEVVISGLGTAITSVVMISEILTNNGFAFQKKILTSRISMIDGNTGRVIQKARMEVVLGKTENFNQVLGQGSASPESPEAYENE
ncbi:uncharacterized protein At2g34160-like isoform X1 [Amborella trichopoda]|uniref:DNA/RNA-binding protein Alba-like domain-containing protein n=1 Tax=Amborella trichopoda TaxID=13333 RepID=W1P1F5_AMBTC|nr:uncharacterized protein At2g34160-like isoform X1 [Amborella trichopoda]ERN01401.1 hypothetical protein AMTR_s00002p00263340 [Amborella trichopoda]|eukprot:XP_020520141.1 uncharacterized protein At2g34160-like isoform X1 [Amborella trichopoda]